MPTLSALLTRFAAKLTDLENYETVDGKPSLYSPVGSRLNSNSS